MQSPVSGAISTPFPPPPPAAIPHITLRRKKSLEQVQLVLGVPAPHVAHPDRYAIYLLNSILGGGMSSRLFQTIREDRGLAYSIFSEMSLPATSRTWCQVPPPPLRRGSMPCRSPSNGHSR